MQHNNPGCNFDNVVDSYPDRPAIIIPFKRGRADNFECETITYRELQSKVDQYARFLYEQGFRKGMRAIFMVKPSVNLYTILLALFKLGVVPIIVDPGMGIKRMMHCYKSANPELFIGIRVAHLIRKLFPSTFAKVKYSILATDTLYCGKESADQCSSEKFDPVDVDAGDLAMVNFTTGSTGPAKGVETTYKMSNAMIALMHRTFDIGVNNVDLVTLPLIGLIDLLLGATTVLADMDPAKPAKAKPEKLLQAIDTFEISGFFASPALLTNLAFYADKNDSRLKHLKYIICGGAPITMKALSQLAAVVGSEEKIHITWGATEGLPLSSINAKTLFNGAHERTNQGRGSCIGKALEGIEVRAIKTDASSQDSKIEDCSLKTNEIGELAVRGPNVSTSYHEAEHYNLEHKMYDQEGEVWHRTGDLGYLDDKKQIWFCGRKSQAVALNDEKKLYTVQCEGVSNSHPAVSRSALVAANFSNRITPVMCIEPNRYDKRSKNVKLVCAEVKQLLQSNELTKDIKHVFYRRNFPVDIRHNAKIQREELAKWASKKGIC